MQSMTLQYLCNWFVLTLYLQWKDITVEGRWTCSVSVALSLSTRYQHPWHFEDGNSCSTWGPAEYHYRRQARAHCHIPDRRWGHSGWSETQQNPGRCPGAELWTWGLYIQSCTRTWCGLWLPEEAVATQLWFRTQDLWGFRHGTAAQRLLPPSGFSTPG